MNNDEIDCPEGIEKSGANFIDIESFQIQCGEQSFFPNDKIDQWCHDGEKHTILERREHHCGNALAHVYFFPVQNKNGEEETTAEHSRCEGGRKFPEHDHIEGIFPADLIICKCADPDHVSAVTHNHHHQSHEDPEGGTPAPGDV